MGLFAACTCENQSLVGNSGSVQSPGFGDFYCDQLNCNYTITVEDGQKIQIDLPVIDLLTQDRVEVLDPRQHRYPLMVYAAALPRIAVLTRGLYYFPNKLK